MSSGSWMSFVSRIYYTLGLTYYIYKWIAFLSLSSFVLAITDYVYNNKITASAIVFVSIGTISLCLFILYASKSHIHITSIPGIKIIEEKLEYRVLGDNKYEYEVSLTAIILQHGLTSTHRRFGWSGLGDMSVSSESGEYKVSLDRSPIGQELKSMVKIDFNKPLRKKQEIVINYIVNLSDEQETAVPYFSLDVAAPRKRSKLKIKILNGTVGRIYKRIYPTMASAIPIYEEIIDNTNVVEWDIFRPRLGSRYVLTWELI